MHSDVAISVKNLTKTYRIFAHPGDRIKQALTFGQKQYHKEFTALKDVSFEIKKGETVGIIGRNGSGKSTLLQLICGILKPTSGSVQVNGRISALLELGAGFNPEFTGRENVYFQGAVMGIAREEMINRFDEIAEFADIGEFIDQPVRTYSSGMFVRLAFATAIHAAPDILVVDEALAVGDLIFQARCFERIKMLKSQGVTILLVSHSMQQILSNADLAILLEIGCLKSFSGDTTSVIAAYESSIRKTERPDRNGSSNQVGIRADLSEKRFGTFEATLTKVVISQTNAESTDLGAGLPTKLHFHVNARRSFSSVILGVSIRQPGTQDLWGDNNLLANCPITLHAGLNVITYALKWPFSNGEYLLYCGLAALEPEGRIELDQRWPMERVHVYSTRQQVGVVYAPVEVTVES